MKNDPSDFGGTGSPGDAENLGLNGTILSLVQLKCTTGSKSFVWYKRILKKHNDFQCLLKK